jgi:hypothetical protein
MQQKANYLCIVKERISPVHLLLLPGCLASLKILQLHILSVGVQRHLTSIKNLKNTTMTTIIKSLFFDKDLVSKIKKSDVDSNVLYVQLISGKITLQEYVAATR